MLVTTNLIGMQANMFCEFNSRKQDRVASKISSGLRILSAADDAAGLAISGKMRAQIRGLDRGSKNIQDGVSLVQTADGALEEVHNMLQRISELCVQASNDTYTSEDRTYIQKEIEEIKEEINNIGKYTTFNTLQIFDDMYGEDVGGSVTTLVSSPAANTGYLTEAIQVGSLYYPAASIDFSNITAKNIKKLNNQGFLFYCSQNCKEIFDIKFTTDGTSSSCSNLVGKVHHYYSVDISQCKTGKELVDTVYNYVSNNLPTGNGASSTNLVGGVKVSHSNNLIKSDDGNKLFIVANTGGKATEEDAKKVYPKGSVPNSGKIDCSQLAAIVDDDKINEIGIHCGANTGEMVRMYTHRINSKILCIEGISVETRISANNGILLSRDAIEKISDWRSELGSFQNRLEFNYNNNECSRENTSASESKIKDADMADELIDYFTKNILAQSGNSMVKYSNQRTEAILSLLQ